MNSYTKLLTDLVNVDVEIDEKDKVVILLNSLPEEEYKTFTLTLINGRKSLNYNEVSVALMNYEVRRQDRLSSSGSITAEALAVRGRSSIRKERGDQERWKSRSDFRDLKRNKCALCKELGYWKVDCPKAKGKKKKSMTEANLTQVVSTQVSTSQADGLDSDSSVFSLSVTTSTINYSDNTEWILDTEATYHVCPNRVWFSNFEKLDGCFIVMGDDHLCNVKGMSTICTKIFDGIV